MGCFPSSGGCEIPNIDPFVAFYNDIMGTKFELEKCLDASLRNSEQPEALYLDGQTGDELVIECKSVVWPKDYLKRHRNDHIIAQQLFEILQSVVQGQPLTIRLSSTPSMNKGKLNTAASQIGNEISVRIQEIASGKILRGSCFGISWIAFLDSGRCHDDPSTGVLVTWRTVSTDCFSENLQSGFIRMLNEQLVKVGRQFGEYDNCLTILLIQGYGDIAYEVKDWWEEALQKCNIPNGINEIWLKTEIYIDEDYTDVQYQIVFKAERPA